MKFRIVLFLLLFGFVSSALANGEGKEDNELQRRSTLTKQGGLSFPQPFTVEFGNPNANPAVKNTTNPAVSTGYYIVDSDDPIDVFWKPVADTTIRLDFEPNTWRRIASGPHQAPDIDNPLEGRPYFQNPATRNALFPYGTDSTDDAFAGPIPIGFPFYFNGVRYDSFYVSTNGKIGLSNRRYFYGDDGSRISREINGVPTFYDPEADDQRGQAGGLSDPTPDDYGYRAVALGLPGNSSATINHVAADAARGLRNPTNGGAGAGVSAVQNYNNNAPIIMPAWGNTQVSVYNQPLGFTDDHSSVWYKRSVSGDKLIIWYQRVLPRGTWRLHHNPQGNLNGTSFGTIDFPANFRETFSAGGRNAYMYASYAVILNRLDSSVNVQFTDFVGRPFVNNRPGSASDWFRWNTTLAVRGQARHNTFNSINNTSSATQTRYTQSTIYYTQNNNVPIVFPTGSAIEDQQTPKTNLVVKFKQWKNTVRAVTTEYRVRPRDPNGVLDYSVTVPATQVNNFELLAGDVRLGSVVPVAIFQNLSNDIQSPNGVNYQTQNIQFRARFRIVNRATGNPVYTRLVRINSFFSDNSNWTLGGYRLGTFGTGANPVFTPATIASNGVPPYAYVQVQFPPFEPNEFIDNQVGRFRAFIIAEPTDSSNQGFRDAWPFDDTTAINLFVMRRLSSFNEDIREFHVIDGITMPSVLKFVNIGTEAVDGDENTFNPPSPRSDTAAQNNENIRLKTPVIKLNRVVDGSDQALNNAGTGGDELRSFPIDLRNRRNATISFAFHRTEKILDYPRGWADRTLIGPEPRVALLEAGPTGQAGGGTQGGAAAANGIDQMWLEFASPPVDQVNNIANIPNSAGARGNGWNWHPRIGGQTAITDNPAFSVFGGGGFRRGFDPLIKDTPLTAAQGLNIRLYDDGKDNEWRKVYVTIPDTFINAPNAGAQNFRFRFRVRASFHTWLFGPSDDDDNFFVKNVRILFPSEVTDIEALSSTVLWPYKETPASQASQVPVRARVANNTGRSAQAFVIRLYIAPQGFENNSNIDSRYVYVKDQTVPFLPGNTDLSVPFPSWNARESAAGENDQYTISCKVKYPKPDGVDDGGDLDPTNDSTFSTYQMTFGTSLSYLEPNQGNDVPSFTEAVGLPFLLGKGLNLLGYNSATYNASTAMGDVGGGGSGQLAMKFTTTVQDTLFGYTAYFASLNSDFNNVRFALYTDQGGLPGAQPIVGSVVNRLRGIDFDGVERFDQYSTYFLDNVNGIVLPPGTYWMAVAQRSAIGIELGASGSRSGVQLGNVNNAPIPGANNINLYLDKSFRVPNRDNELLSSNFFAIENSLGSNAWNGFLFTRGNLGYPHLNHGGFLGTQNSYTRGTWIPMIKPYFGKRNFGTRKFIRVTPVELTDFNGEVRNSTVDLWWETASEKNNSGFYIERRNSGNDSWNDMTFVGSQAQGGSSTTPLNYGYNDKSVLRGNEYEYRLRQVDLDGTINYSNVLKFAIGGEGDVVLGQNAPNPTLDGETTIPFTISTPSNVRLEIVDVMGNSVRLLINGSVGAGSTTVKWDGTDNSGVQVPSGTYIYRLVVGDRVESRKLSVVR